MSQILIIDDEHSICRTLKLHLGRQGHDVHVAHDAEQGLKYANRYRPGIIILDNRMPGMDGIHALPLLKKALPEAFIIMVTAFHDMATTIQAMNRGAMEFIHKPIDIGEIEQAIHKAESYLSSSKESSGFEVVSSSQEEPITLIGKSYAMKEVYKSIGLLSRWETPAMRPVLIQGESGTGKELVAKVIHFSCSGQESQFVALNCAVLDDVRMEKALFGFHTAPETTHNLNTDQNKASAIYRGVLFLDEVEKLSTAIQFKLFRALMEHRLTWKNHALPSWIVASTSQELAQEVTAGRFREDLYHRLGVVTIHLPPLRERREDIPDLVRHLLKRVNRETGRHVSWVPDSVMETLVNAPWSGNVQQLENTLMKAVAMSHGRGLTLEDLPEELRKTEDEGNSVQEDISLEAMEKRHIIRVLRKTGWHKGQTCELLGLSRPRLDRKIKQYKIKK